MVKPLTVYKASAGSGKTFTLATEYIKLVVRNPLSYKNILAVTFTNKATEEMKMRILSQLYGIWKRLPESENYIDKVSKELEAPREFVSERAGLALNQLLHNYSYFRVMTIDTFFQSVLRNLARELELTPNLRIGLNDFQIEEMAVDLLIEDLQATDQTLQWILKYIMENISDDRSWNVIGQIKQFGKTIFRDFYKAESKLLNETLGEKGFFEDYTKRLKELRDKTRDRMQQIAESFIGMLEEEGLTVEDLSFGKSGVAGFFLKMQAGIFDASIEGKRVSDCIGQPEKWYKKTHPRKNLIHAMAEGQLGEILQYAVKERPRQWKIYQSANLTLRHLNQLRLLSSIEQKVRSLNEDANRFLLSDTQQLLNALICNSDSPFIFEKIGTQLDHVMIDEFQDTSTIQWKNFQVLLLEAMSRSNAENLIVGDVKQSIYRWRSGDWRLLNDIKQQFNNAEQTIDIRSLNTNYRSEHNIIVFNNLFFKAAANLEAISLEDMPEAEQLKRAYADVIQNVPDFRQEKGFVSIQLLSSENYQEQTLYQLVLIIDTLISQGMPQNDIAILVRTNSMIPLIANYFLETRPEISIVSDEAFRLDASLAVNGIINSMKYIANPQDELSRRFLTKAFRHEFNDKSLKNLSGIPLPELAEKLFQILRLEQMPEESAYICTFFDYLNEFAYDSASSLEDFIHEWDENLCNKTIQSSELNGIRLISIHKSKGLEFNTVLIPFCDWQLEKQSGNILWCHPEPSPFNELPLVPIDYSLKGMKETIYEDDYLHEHFQNKVDNLNLLYVAFTRACQNLFVLGKRGSKSTRSAIIEQALPLIAEDKELNSLTGFRFEMPNDEESTLSFCIGALELCKIKANPSVSSSNTPTSNVFLNKPKPLAVSLQSYETRAKFHQSNQSKQFITPNETSTTDYVQIGSILHNVFSTIRTKDDISLALEHLQMEGILYNAALTPEKISQMLRKRLEHPKVQDWFSERWTIFNECTILSTNQQGEIIERRPDRVMTDGRSTVVVDFKFGSQREEYHEQIRQYMQLLRQMGLPNVSGFLWFVYSNKIEEVI